MGISLYDLSVPSFLQILDATSGFLDKSLTYFREKNIDPEVIVETRLFPDMQPFRFQVQKVAQHSIGAIEAVKSGVLTLSRDRIAHDYAGLQALIADTRDALRKVTPEEVNVREGADMEFQVPNNTRLFTAEGFLMSFSLPNFHFHATTAYDILRSKGVPVGKRDYMGALRLKG